MALLKDKRFLFLFTLMVLACISFWLSSRYPSLDAKAMMAGDINMEDGLSFDAWLSHTDRQVWWQHVLITFINWLHTNRQGMSFGLAIALIVMSIVPLIRHYIRLNPKGASSSLLGVLFGVCVNCAAPIAFAMYRRGARAEMAVAAMISSPTLNVIVLTMLFSFFTWPVVLIKLGLTAAVLFIVIPCLFGCLRMKCKFHNWHRSLLRVPILMLLDGHGIRSLQT